MITRKKHEAALAEIRQRHDAEMEELCDYYAARVTAERNAHDRTKRGIDLVSKHSQERRQRINAALDLLDNHNGTVVSVKRMREVLS